VFLKEFGKHGRSTRGLFFLRFEFKLSSTDGYDGDDQGVFIGIFFKDERSTELMTGWFVCLFVKRGFAT
jgi:hypothetical protein